ncbi:hypothetical protein [Bradyrhizobium sp. SZCCHNR2028]|uniref:hypothetical protein n=1 Tax=Bradyrhizobium sp. SZCCHNR2028 TaxID=3057382 RepID=UPI0028EF3DEA|nr:hypothetical protein [Bradyrhizobium sp. SZCCHNR2028]
MAVAIFKSAIEVDGRLAALGLNRESLLEVVTAMVAGKAACTENDPPSAPGWSSWRHGVRRSREVLRPRGWLKDDTDQMSCVVNHTLGMRITVANTDEQTGQALPGSIPQNRARKGAATDRAVDGTQQTLFGLLTSKPDGKVILFTPRARHSSTYATFYICVFNEGDVVRAEFSCPISVESGFFTGFSERIILVGPGDWPPSVKSRQELKPEASSSEFDIPVRRK